MVIPSPWRCWFRCARNRATISWQSIVWPGECPHPRSWKGSWSLGSLFRFLLEKLSIGHENNFLLNVLRRTGQYNKWREIEYIVFQLSKNRSSKDIVNRRWTGAGTSIASCENSHHFCWWCTGFLRASFFERAVGPRTRLNSWLGGGNSNMFYVPENWGCMIQLDFCIFFRWVEQEPTN